jgi:hypothetical protein
MSTEREEWIETVDRLDRCEQRLADLRAKVGALPSWVGPNCTHLWVDRDEVLALLDRGDGWHDPNQ